MDFLFLFRQFIEYHGSASILHDKRKPKTLEGYSVRYNSIAAYLLSKGTVKLKAKDFSMRIANDYFAELSEKHSHNYAVRNVEVCKMVLEYAAGKELIKFNPLNSFKIKKVGPGKPVYLTPSELIQVEKYIPKLSMTNKARRLFLFQAYTGLDYGDLMSVSVSDVITHKDRRYIVKKRLKTGIEACVPLSNEAERYFPDKHDLLSNQKYNAALKIIFIDLGVNKRITSHIGRKTYAMIKLNYEGYSIEAVSKMAGHKSVKTTETYYAQVEIDLIHRELDRLGI